MCRSLLPLALIFLPALAGAGQLTLSPSSFTLDNGVHSPTVTVAYRPGAGVVDFEAELTLPLDRAGWVEAQVVPSGTTAFEAWCQIVNGRVKVILSSRNLQPLPTAQALPLCAVRIRTHGFTPRGHYEITPVNTYEYTATGVYDLVTTNTVRVVVP